MFESSFVKTQTRIFDDKTTIAHKFIDFWNKLVGKIRFLKISEKNLTLLSAYRMFFEESHKTHSKLLELGMDAMTLKLELDISGTSHFESLADYFKLVEYAYRIAESNDRAIESTYFTYLIANQTHCLLKDMIIIIGFFFYAFGIVYVK